MREILFKAKRIDNGEWVEGYYWTNLIGNYFIRITQEKTGKFVIEDIEILPDTLCQFTELADKNDNKIWENDICTIKDGTLDEEDGSFVCKWDDDTARYILDGYGLTVDFDNVNTWDVEVIGNIFDNADLLS